jgi:hemoglobin-like flavoprotein
MSSFSIPDLKASYALVEPRAAEVGRAFYDRLFQRHPALRGLFGDDIDGQSFRLMTMIGAGIGLLDHPDRLDGALRELGARHLRYGVREAHYPIVGRVLLDTLHETLGEDFTAEAASAWSGFYDVVVASMMAGARAAAESAPAVAGRSAAMAPGG